MLSKDRMKKAIRLLLNRCLMAMMLIMMFAASPATAQINDPSVKDGNIDMMPAKRPIVEYSLAGGFLIAALAIGFKPAKRSEE